MEKDPGTIIAEEIDRKEGREVRRTMLPVDKRVRLHDLLQAAKISIAEADEKNRDLSGTIDEIMPVMVDIAGTIEEASALLAEQAEQLR